MATELILASGNLHKIGEFRTLFRKCGLDIDLTSLRQYKDYESPEEVGSTFEENARIKAMSAANHFGKMAIADDSGLVVPALGGEPGVYSARYAGSEATDQDNRKKLLEKMEGLTGIERQAYFECVLVVATPEEVLITVRGTSEGEIVEKARGRHGFGYDPIFQKHGYNQTFAELDDLTKHRISHRGKAFEALLVVLESQEL